MSKTTHYTTVQEQLEAARAARSAKATKRRNLERFLVAERGGNSQVMVGWAKLVGYTGLSIASLRVMFSQGGGKLDRKVTDLFTGEPVLVEITRLGVEPEPEQPSKPRGRPLKKIPSVDELGTEAAHAWRPRQFRSHRTRG